MSISESIRENLDNPAALEALFREARQSQDEAAFIEAIEDEYQRKPGNILLAAWHHRLTSDAASEVRARRVNWLLAVALSILAGLVFWALSDEDLSIYNGIPALFHVWAPITVLFILGFLGAEDPSVRRRAIYLGAALVLVSVYALLIGRIDFPYQRQYTDLIAIHLPLLSWAAVGLTLTLSGSDPRSAPSNRFAFIRKSLEIFVTGGLYLIAGMIFGGITIGMFEALDVNLPEVILRLITAGGTGLLPMLALASVYDAHRPPEKQVFGQGVGRLVPIVTQLLLPLSLLVLLVYIAVIPFNFFGPFRSREVLIVYNIMLFAVVGLLVGATPIEAGDIAPNLRSWVRRGIIAVAILAVLVSLYALAAVLTRTVQGGWTANRITVIGWNTVNIGILISLVVTQLRLKTGDWAAELKKTFGKGALVYVAWGLALVLLLPLFLAMI